MFLRIKLVNFLLSFLFIWITRGAVVYGQIHTIPLPESEKITATLKKLLPAGTIQASVMDSLVMNPRLQELILKFQQGIRANPQYVLDMQNRAATKGTGPIPYDKRVGMSEPEFKELQTLIDKRELKVAPSYTGTLAITQVGGAIRFAGTGRLAMLNDVWIDLSKNEVHFLDYILPYKQELNIAGSQNAYNSPWTAYEWKFAEPADENFENLTLEKIKTMKLVQLQFEVGKLTKTGKTFMKLKASKIDKGVKKYSIETPFILQ